MKLSLVALSVLSLVAGSLAMACNDEPSTLQSDDKDARENTPLDAPSTSTPSSGDKSSSNSSNSGSNANNTKSTPPDAGPKPGAGTKSCSAETTQASCAKCCGAENNPLNSCACDTGSKCAADCGDNLCAQKLPSFKCGLCLAQANCDVNGGGGDGPGAAIQACMDQSGCADKPQQ